MPACAMTFEAAPESTSRARVRGTPASRKPAPPSGCGMRALRDHQREPRAPERDVTDRLFGGRLRAHVAAVTARHPSHHGQADARTAVGSRLGAVCLKEWLDHALGRMLRN